MGEHLLKVSNLIKTFDKVPAVSDVSFFEVHWMYFLGRKNNQS